MRVRENFLVVMDMHDRHRDGCACRDSICLSGNGVGKWERGLTDAWNRRSNAVRETEGFEDDSGEVGEGFEGGQGEGGFGGWEDHEEFCTEAGEHSGGGEEVVEGDGEGPGCS